MPGYSMIQKYLIDMTNFYFKKFVHDKKIVWTTAILNNQKKYFLYCK